MPNCSLKRCNAHKSAHQPRITIHRFPKNAILRQKWLDIIGAENINTRHKLLRICSQHFEESYFNRTLDVVRLRDDAVPALHLLPLQKTSSTCASKIKNAPQRGSTVMTQSNLYSDPDSIELNSKVLFHAKNIQHGSPDMQTRISAII